MSEVAKDLGCDWHTVMDAVIYFGAPLIDDPNRYGTVDALGLDETLFCRVGRWRTQCWSTQIVDVRRGQLLDVVPGRDAAPSCAWLAARPQQWRDRIRWATLDLSGPYRNVFDTMLPDAVQVADPSHVVKLAGTCVDEVRRRVQNDTFGHYAGDRCQEAVLSRRSRRLSKIFCRPSWPLVAASSRCLRRVGLNSTVVTKNVQDSQIDSKWQSSSTGLAQ